MKKISKNLLGFFSPRVLVFICPFILLAPVWLTGKALYWGTPSTQFIPWWWQAWQTLRTGELPLWNPLVGMGAPLLANYQSALLYPPNWLYFVLAAIGGLPLMAWGQAILVAAHLAFAGWGMLKLLEKLGLSEFAQTIGALAFSLSGYLVARAHFLSINSTVAWLPWILLAGYELAKIQKSWRSVLKLSAFLALQWLAGHAQLAWYTLLLAFAWVLYWGAQHGDLKKLTRLVGRFASASLLALALSAIQLLPTAEYLTQSQRATQYDPAFSMVYSFWPWRFLTLLAPNAFGNPAHGNYWGYGNFWEDAVYVGIMPLLLGIASLRILRRKGTNQKLNLFLVGLIPVSFLLALGDRTSLFPWLSAHIPTFNLFQGPTRFSIWAVFAICVLAAIAADLWQRPQGRSLYWSRLAVAATVAVIFGAALAFWLNLTGKIQVEGTLTASTLGVGLIAFAIALLNLRIPKRPGSINVWHWLVCMLLAVDLLYAGWGLNPASDLELYKENPQLHAALRAELGQNRLYLPAADEQSLKFDYLFRFDTFFFVDPRTIRATLLPNISLLDRIPSANNFDPILPARYQDWIDALSSAPAAQQNRMLALMNVGVVEHLIPNEGASVSFQTVGSYPRARWVSCAFVVADRGEAIQAALSEDLDLDQNVLLEAENEVDREGCTPNLNAEVEIVTASANRVEVSVDAEQDGWLVLADTWFPGWQAYVDERETEIYPAYGLFRAVKVPAGNSLVEFVYQPRSFTTGLFLSIVAWPILFILWKRND